MNSKLAKTWIFKKNKILIYIYILDLFASQFFQEIKLQKLLIVVTEAVQIGRGHQCSLTHSPSYNQWG